MCKYMLYNKSMLLDQHKKFVGCDVHSELLAATHAYLALAFLSQVLSPKSNISDTAEVKAAAKVGIDETAVLLRNKKKCVGSPAWTACYQRFLGHTLPYISALFETYFVLEICPPYSYTCERYCDRVSCIRRKRGLFGARVRPGRGV